MARPKSEDKRKLLLTVATQVFANKGLSAPTASITSAAGLAEGTLFVYFKGKDDLINTLYQEVKSELADAMLAGYSAKASIYERTRHVWNNYVEWGAKNPDQLSVLHKIKVWEGLRPETRDALQERFCELHILIESAVKEGIYQDMPHEFIFAMMSAQAETTMQFIRQDPDNAKLYKDNGFEMYWGGISKKS